MGAATSDRNAARSRVTYAMTSPTMSMTGHDPEPGQLPQTSEGALHSDEDESQDLGGRRGVARRGSPLGRYHSQIR